MGLSTHQLLREYFAKKKRGEKTSLEETKEELAKKNGHVKSNDMIVAPKWTVGTGKKKRRYEECCARIDKLVKKGCTKPKDIFQYEGVFRIEQFEGRCILGDDMGLGKTYQSLMYIKLHPEIKTVVVVCPVNVKHNWREESWKHVHIRSSVLSTTSVPKRGIVSAPRIIIINYDVLGDWLEALTDLEPDLVILDEIHMIGNPATKRYKNVHRLCEDIPQIIGLTGTLISNKVIEIWTSINLIRPDLYPSYTEFADEYCQPTQGFRGIEYKGATNLEKLHAELTKYLFIRRLKSDVLPDRLPKTRKVMMVDIADRPQYEEARDSFLDWLERVAPHKVASAARAEGLVRIGYLIRLAAKLKKRPCRTFLNDFLYNRPGKKMIVFAVNEFMVRGYHEKYKSKSLVVDGKVTGLKRHETYKKFKTLRRYRLLFANIRAGGLGWNGEVASRCLFLQLPWTPGALAQAEDRIDRLTQVARCRYYYIIAKNTIEERLANILEEKQKISDAVLDGRTVPDGIDIYSRLCEELLRESKQGKRKKKKRRRHHSY